MKAVLHDERLLMSTWETQYWLAPVHAQIKISAKGIERRDMPSENNFRSERDLRSCEVT